MSDFGSWGYYSRGGYGYGWADYDPEEEARRRAAELQVLRDEQFAIDSAPKADRAELNRRRIAKRVVELAAIEPWDVSLTKLDPAPVDRTEVAAAPPVPAVPRPWWMKAPVVVTDADRAQRFPHDGRLNAKVALIQADITTLGVDAIVNAANGSLLGGGGIDGAIHKAAGDLLVEECRPLKGCAVGSAKMTRGYRLPARYVIHTVGPMGSGDAELASCYESSLELFLNAPLLVPDDDPLRSIALCGISTGIYGFPLIPATHIAFHTTRVWLESLSAEEFERVDRIVFCVFTDEELSVYKSLMPSYFPPSTAPVAQPASEPTAPPASEPAAQSAVEPAEAPVVETE